MLYCQHHVKAKRNPARREFALGVEDLERFVAGPLPGYW